MEEKLTCKIGAADDRGRGQPAASFLHSSAIVSHHLL